MFNGRLEFINRLRLIIFCRSGASQIENKKYLCITLCILVIMILYYPKRALQILRHKGFIELSKASFKFIRRHLGLSKRDVSRYRLYDSYTKRLRGYRAIADPFKLVLASPDQITRYSSAFGKWESVGLIAGGNWDKEASPLKEMMKYQAIKQRFEKGLSWEETGIIDYHYERLSNSDRDSVDGCSSRSEYRQWYSEIDRLYNDIRDNGYDLEKHSPTDSIAVHIGRDGELIFAGSGCHRLCICKMLDINKIPVWIRARHKKWQDTREQIHKHGIGSSLDQELCGHPDLQDVI